MPERKDGYGLKSIIVLLLGIILLFLGIFWDVLFNPLINF